MSRRIVASDVSDFVEHLHARRATAALSLALALADDGVPVSDIMTDLIGPAQVEVGERWYQDDYSIADEHAATSVADMVLTLLSAHGNRQTGTGPHVLALCPEKEWHTMPLRLVAQAFELEDMEVTFLGGSIPSDHLARFLDRVHPDVVALSCSTPLAFDGVLNAVEIAHGAGLPVIAGGRAFGMDDRRAVVLGVDHWAPTAAAGAALARSATGTALRTPTARIGVVMELALDRGRLLDEAMEELRRRLPSMADSTPLQLQRTRTDLELVLLHAEAAIFVDDDRVFDEYLQWVRPLIEYRKVPLELVDVSLAVLQDIGKGALAGLLERPPVASA